MADLEQQQHTAVVPPANPETGHPYAADNANTNNNDQSSTYSPFAWLKSPKGILRLVEWFFSILIFGTMASVSGFDNESAFQFEVAVGVLIFLYTLGLIASYIFAKTVERYCLYQPVIELAMDGIFCVLLLAAGCAAAVTCNKDRTFDVFGVPFISYSYCDSPSTTVRNNLKASIVFTFFELIAFSASTFFSYRENAMEERRK